LDCASPLALFLVDARFLASKTGCFLSGFARMR
jgi:hypothetical protein